MSRTTPVPMVFFGKLPSRGDFVRSTQQAVLTQRLDRWLTQAIELMAQDTRWKQVYDLTPPVHFALLRSRHRDAWAGHLLASSDAAGRRFPFVAAGTFEVDAPQDFMGRSPLVLARLWARFEQAARGAFASTDAAAHLSEMNQSQVEIDLAAGAYEAGYRDFLELQTVDSLQRLLQASDRQVDVRRMVLALGLLLQPVPASGSNQLEKGVRLPLPADPLLQPLVATLWLDLVAPFLARGDFEVVLYLPRRAADGVDGARLLIGFAGATPASLHAALDARVAADAFVTLSRPDWVDACTEQDYGVKKLSSYLDQPQLSLLQARTTFREVFLGE